MEEICVGEYVRTKKGEICKVLGVRQEQRVDKRVYSHLAYYLDNHKGSLTPAFIVKHSLNITDLMQVKDVIEYIEQTEGGEGTKVGETYITDIHSKNELNEIKKEIQKNGIKLLSITTKEQINQVKYEV